MKNSYNKDNKTFRGRIYGYHSVPDSRYRGFSTVFEQNSETSLRVFSKTGVTPVSAGTAFFTASGDYDFAVFVATSNSRNGRYLATNLDPTTGMGTLKFAWQAGQNDRAARVFQATATRTRGDAGLAYFGFGEKLSNPAAGEIGGMICNWAGPGNIGSGYNVAGKAQGQSFSRTGTTGVFLPGMTKIAFTPNNSCFHTPADNFAYAKLAGAGTLWGADGSAVPAALLAAHELDTVTSLGAIPTLTAPVFAP